MKGGCLNCLGVSGVQGLLFDELLRLVLPLQLEVHWLAGWLADWPPADMEQELNGIFVKVNFATPLLVLAKGFSVFRSNPATTTGHPH